MRKLLIILGLILSVMVSGQVITHVNYAYPVVGESEPSSEFPPYYDDGNTQALYIADASYLTITNDSVSQWDDASGGGNHLTQSTSANRPIFAGDSVTFTSATTYDYMTASFTVNDTSTWYVVATMNDYTSTADIVYSGANMIFEHSNSNTRVRIVSGGAFIQAPYESTNYDSTRQVYICRFVSEGTSGIVTNGYSEVTATAGTISTNASLIVGDANKDSNMSVSEIYIRSGEDNTTQRDSIYNYYVTKFEL